MPINALQTSKNQPIVVAIGELLWDLLPQGRQLGGAPANFALHAAALGTDARLVTCVGNDSLGQAALKQLRAGGVSTEAAQIDPVAPTGTVTITLGAGGLPAYEILPDVAWDRLAATPAALGATAVADVVCFGTLSQRTSSAATMVCRLVAATRPGVMRMFDINLRPPFISQAVIEQSLKLANAVKVNDEELLRLAAMFDLQGETHHQITALAERYGLSLVVVTRGADGSVVLADGNWSDVPGHAVDVVDTVGAGDALTASLVVGLLAGLPLNDAHRVAADLAAYVCTQRGATPPFPEALRRPILNAFEQRRPS